MSEGNIFRFLVLRPARARARDEGTVAVDADPEVRRSPFLIALRDKRVAVEETRKFRATPGYAKQVRDLSGNLETFQAWAIANAHRRVGDLDIAAAVQAAFKTAPAELVASQDFRTLRTRVAERIVADSIQPSDRGDGDGFVMAKKLLRLIDLLSRGPADLTGTDTLAQLLGRWTVTIPDVLSKPEREAPDPIPSREPEDDDREIRDRLRVLEEAHRELVDLSRDARSVDEGDPRDTTPSGPTPAAPTTRRRIAAADPIAIVRQRPVSQRSLARITAPTRSLLGSLDLAPEEVEVETAAARLENEMEALSAQLSADEQHPIVLLLGGGEVDVKSLKASLHPSAIAEAAAALPAWALFHNVRYQAGVGDLLIVRQKLKAYELVDFAHVENVLQGELREREHRRLQVREEVLTLSTEKETEKERNLQSTERNEMQTEAEKTVSDQFKLDAGAQLSGSYGPSLTFSTSLNASFSTSAEESQSKATSYSREVVEKTAEKVREKVSEQRQMRTLDQIEEINKHVINNSQAGSRHVRGIYRWLNKVYEAQVFNYGQRMMFEFLVPEPAANYLYAFVENPPKNVETRKPSPPMFGKKPLLPRHLRRSNYQQYVQKYDAPSAPPYPSTFTVVSYFEKHDATENEDSEEVNRAATRASKIVVPDGYEAFKVRCQCFHLRVPEDEPGYRHLSVKLGGRSWYSGDPWQVTKAFPDPIRGELAVVVGFRGVAFAVAVDVVCRLTDQAKAKWQNDVYEAIIDGYRRQKAEYDEKVAAANIQKGIEILGKNPLENRRVEREELKKSVISMLIDSNKVSRNSFETGAAPPRIDFDRADKNGSFIRFWENAFEWHNMIYVFYPYFWGRASRALAAMRITDPDPDFAAFLKAGAARVQVPVRPGFERAVAHFQQFGKLWMGDDPPLRDDDLYVPVINEITENLGKLDAGVPYPEGSEPWDVTLPTSLVVLQDLEEIPGVRDVLTGQNVDLTGADG